MVREVGESTDRASVVGVGVCSQVNTDVFVDDAGDALRPAIVWQDQRCAEIARELDNSIGDDQRQQLWGGPFKIDSSFSLVRLAWLADYEPELRERVRHMLYPKDYVNFRLAGGYGTDFMSPVGLVGPAGDYIAGVLDLVEGGAQTRPPIRDFTDVLGTVTAPELPALAGKPVAVGAMDAWGSIYGSGLVDPGVAMEICGTSEILAIASVESHPNAGVISFPPKDGLTVHAGPTQAGGDAVRWWAEGQGRTIDDMLAAAAEVDALDVPIFHPYLAGERAPLWDAQARSLFFGVTAEHDFRHFSRAVLDGVAFAARHLLEELQKAAGLKAGWVHSSGGGARSDLWCQSKADVFGREVRRLRVLDSGVLGAGLMGAVAGGLFDDLPSAARETVAVADVFRPTPEMTLHYDRRYAIYRQLYEVLQPAYAAWARL